MVSPKILSLYGENFTAHYWFWWEKYGLNSNLTTILQFDLNIIGRRVRNIYNPYTKPHSRIFSFCDRFFFVTADNSQPSPALMTTVFALFPHIHYHFVFLYQRWLPLETWARCKVKPKISQKRNSILRKISTAIQASYYNKILAKNNLFDSVTISK